MLLLARVSASGVAVLVRGLTKAADIASLDVDIRRGDMRIDALKKAFRGVEKLILISAIAFTDAITQYRDVLVAARDTAARHVIYTAIRHPADSTFAILQVTE